MATASEIRAIQYHRERATGNLKASFNGAEITLHANRLGLHLGGKNITSYTASVNGKKVGATGTLQDAKVFAGLELLDMGL